MHSKKKHLELPFILLLSGVFIIVFYLIFGFYFEVNDDLFFIHFLRGDFFQFPVTDLLLYHKYTAFLYAWLYKKWDLPWYEIVMYFFLFISIALYFKVIINWIRRYTNWSWVAQVMIMISLLFFSFFTSIVLLNFTRVAFFMASGVIFMLAELIIYPPEKRFKVSIFICWMLFVLALFTRFESALLSIGLLLPFMILFYPVISFKKLLYIFLPLFLLIGFDKIDDGWNNNSREYFRKILPYWGNVMDAKHSHYPLNSSSADSMRYVAALDWFTGDLETTNEIFFSKIASKKTFDLAKLNKARILNALADIGKFVNRSQFLFSLIIFIAATWLLLKGKKGHLIIRFILFNVMIIGIILAIAIFMKMLPRVLSPILHIYTCCNLFIMISHLRGYNIKVSKYSRAALYCCVSLTILYLGYNRFYQMKVKEGDNFHDRVTKNIEFLDYISKTFREQYVVFHLPAITDVITHQRVFLNTRTNIQFVLYDAGWLSLLKQYPIHLKKICGSEKISDLFNFFSHNSSKVVFLSTQERNEFILEYMRKVYNQSYNFKELAIPGVIISTDTLRFYRLE